MALTRYVIIGASAAGMSAAQSIREVDPHGTITVLSAESDPPYFRPLIPFIVDGKKAVADIPMLGQGPYTATGIDVRLDSTVTAVSTSAQTVTVHGSETVPYDNLLIATGSHPYLPPSIKGTGDPGVFALRTLSEAQAMAKRISTSQEAILAGGGMLNLKTAFAVLERGLRVTMVVTSPEILSQIMEPDGATLIRQALKEAGLRILTGRSITQIIAGPTGVSAVVLDTGEELPAQIVNIGKGVRPNVEFLAGSGIHLERGVVADTHTACNVPNVYTAGDVAVTFDPITGERMMTALWTNAVEMGRVAGRNMADHPTAYTGTFGILNATQVAEVPFVSMGIVQTAGTAYETDIVATAETYRKLVFTADGTRLIGAVFVGDISHAGLYRHLIRERMSVGNIKNAIVGHRLHYGHFLLP